MSGASGLIISKTQQGSCHILVIQGPLDHETVTDFTSAVDTAVRYDVARHIVVDITAIATLDSSILAAMLNMKRYATTVGRNLWFLVMPSSSIDRILSTANLLNRLGVVYEIDDLGPKPRPQSTLTTRD